MSIRITGCLAALLCLAGCALASAPNRVQTQSPSAITILTDPALRGLPQAQQVAQAHCRSFGKQAVQTQISGKLQGGRAAVTFACR